MAVSKQHDAKPRTDSIGSLRFKVGNTVDVEQRVIAALPAVPLHHLMQVPTAIPVRSGVSYFEIEPNNDLYQRMFGC